MAKAARKPLMMIMVMNTMLMTPHHHHHRRGHRHGPPSSALVPTMDLTLAQVMKWKKSDCDTTISSLTTMIKLAAKKG